MSFSSVRRATSRRTGSKLETVIASGVSSIIRSTPGYSLERADISALASDYAALHLVVGQSDNGNGGLRRMVCGAALNGGAR